MVLQMRKSGSISFQRLLDLSAIILNRYRDVKIMPSPITWLMQGLIQTNVLEGAKLIIVETWGGTSGERHCSVLDCIYTTYAECSCICQACTILQCSVG